MKINNIAAINFGSFEHLLLKFDHKGFTVIQGDTGAGKSTIFNAISWCLYGETPKNLKANEIQKWGTNKTTATVEIEVKDQIIKVVRIRSNKQAENDFYFEINGEMKRGKDAKETQILFNKTFNTSFTLFSLRSNLYASGIASTSLSSTSALRKELFEQIVDLSYINKLKDNTNEAIKANKAYLRELELKEQHLANIELTHLSHYNQNEKKSIEYDSLKQKTILEFTLKRDNFDKNKIDEISALELSLANKIAEKEHLESLKLDSNECRHCHRKDEKAIKTESKISYLETIIKEAIVNINKAKNKINDYNELLEKEKLKQNPFESLIISSKEKLTKAKNDRLSLKQDIQQLNEDRIYLIEFLSVLESSKVLMLENAFSQIEYKTNELLSTYFDGIFSIKMQLEEKNGIDLTIQKDDIECSFNQLSKGQQAILKLCYSIAILYCANNTSESNLLIVDEMLDGLSEEMKTKALSVFYELLTIKDSIYLIDHSPSVQNEANTTITIKLTDNGSKLTY